MKHTTSNNYEIPKIALLIDAENVSESYLAVIIKELHDYGSIVTRRVYGDWSSDNLKKWRNKAYEHAFNEVHISSNVKGKNSSDIGIVINAMDILHSNDVDIFCLVSSDSDFTKLNLRLRESNKYVVGMGEKSKSNGALTSSCNRFIYLEDLMSKYDIYYNREPLSREELLADDNLLSIINRYIDNLMQKNEKVHLGELKSKIINAEPDFTSQKYGYEKFANFLKAFNLWEFDTQYRHIIGFKEQ